MDSSSTGISSNSSGLQNSGSEEDLQLKMDQKKIKRMISNRESARRSRLRKRKHLDGLMAQVAMLRSNNHQILTSLNVTTQHYLGVEAENSVLRAQAAELSHRLQSLNEIVSFLGAGNIDDLYAAPEPDYGIMSELDGLVNSSWNCLSQPTFMTAAPADNGFMY